MIFSADSLNLYKILGGQKSPDWMNKIVDLSTEFLELFKFSFEARSIFVDIKYRVQQSFYSIVSIDIKLYVL